MARFLRRNSLLIAGLLAALAVAAAAWALVRPEVEKPRLGLLTTLPIYWSESADISEMLARDGEPPRARQALERDYRLVPLDTLDPRKSEQGDPQPTLGDLDYLLLAQPRALQGLENVALDEWVREGGRVLVFADPMLTGHSRFHIGDRRRPQDVVLLSPILRRWGLDLRFDDEQAEGERMSEFDGAALPLNLAGHFETIPTAPDAPSQCKLFADGAATECTIGQGTALVVADAALFEEEMASDERQATLAMLAERAFGGR